MYIVIHRLNAFETVCEVYEGQVNPYKSMDSDGIAFTFTPSANTLDALKVLAGHAEVALFRQLSIAIGENIQRFANGTYEPGAN